MIAYLKGKLIHKEPTYVVLEVNGIGYQVIPPNTFSEIKDQEDLRLSTYMHVREDAHILFGFATDAEKQMFQYLISVNGVGPNTALVVVLSYLPPNELRAAIVREDAGVLQAVKGIGGNSPKDNPWVERQTSKRSLLGGYRKTRLLERIPCAMRR